MNKNSLKKCPKCDALIPEEASHGLCPRCVLADAATLTEEGESNKSQHIAPDPGRLAEAFPQLEIMELIGQGGMGFVYRAEQAKLERSVALKILPEKLAQDPAFAERFRREGRMLAKLNHPNIVSVFDFGQAGGFFFLLMEYVDGVNLRQAMRESRFTPEQALTIVPPICEALQFAHDEGVLHRDIKPENILLDVKGRVKIVDFGIAKMVGEGSTNPGLTATGARLGTPHYMAPEQVEHPSSVDHRADIYSLGVVFYELLTGELPIGRFGPPSSKSMTSSELDEIVLRALEKDRKLRQQSASELKTQIETLGKHEPESGHGPVATREEARDTVRGKVKYASYGLYATGIINCLWVAVPLVVALSGVWSVGVTQWAMIIGCLLISVVGVGVLMLIAGGSLSRMENRGLVLTAGVLSILTAPFTWIGLPIGIWILVLLHQPTVEKAFSPSPNHTKRRHEFKNPWPRRLFITVICLVIGLVLFIAMGVIVPMLAFRSERSERNFALEIDAVLNADGRFSAELPIGALELVAVCNHPSENELWWHPITGEQVPGYTNPGNSSGQFAGFKPYEFVIRSSGLPESASRPICKVIDSSGWAGGGHPSQNGVFLKDTYHFSATVNAEAVNAAIVIGVAIGNWEKVTEARTGGNSSSFSFDGQSGHVEFVNANEDRDGNTVVVVSFVFTDFEVRLVAQDLEGKEHQGSANRMNDHLTVTFRNLSLDQIDRFSFQARRYKWVLFNGIRLQPAIVH